MCGRIANMATPDELRRAFEWVRRDEILDILEGPQYNLGPQRLLPAIRAAEGGDEWAVLRWGLIPSWAKSPEIASQTFNARAETVAEKPAFRDAYRKRRCLIPVSGFYEWKRAGKSKQAYFIRMPDEPLFTLAGLWERWHPAGADVRETCTVVTTTPNILMADLHDRMPVIVSAEERDLWLHEGNPEVVHHVLRPFDPARMEAYPVSDFVNSVRNEGPECIAPMQSLFPM